MTRRLSLGAAALAAVFCAAPAPGEETPRAPEVRWVPPADAVPPAPTPAPPPPDFSVEKLANRTISLFEAIDVALRTNPVTRQSWLLTQAAAADVGSERSAYYPAVEADLSAIRQKQSALGGSVTTLSTTYAPSVGLNWLLLDLGGRGADVEEAKRRLYAANFTHNATMNDLMLGVAQAYYLYQGSRALLVAQDASLKQARENYSAAEERHRAGVATIADVLQARTVLSQQKLAYDQVSGQIQTFRGQLATALGAPVDLPVDAAELPEDVQEDASVATVDRLIAEAERSRPDLAAARARAQADHAHIASARSAGLPTLTASAFAGPQLLRLPRRVRPLHDELLGRALPARPALHGIQDRLRHEERRGHGPSRRRRRRVVRATGHLPGLEQLLRRPDGRAAGSGLEGPPRERDGVRGGRARTLS